jgi:hypothetical protein
MSEHEQAERLEQMVRDMHIGRSPETEADAEQRLLLEVAASLQDPGFRPSDAFQERLYGQLSARSTATYSTHRRKQQMKNSFGFMFKSAAWIGAAALLVLALTWAIQNQMGTPSQPQPAAISQPTAVTAPGPEEAAGFRLEAGDISEVEDGYAIPLRIVPVDAVDAWVTLPVQVEPVRMFGGDAQMPFVMTNAAGERIIYDMYEYPASGAEGYSYKLPGKAIHWPVTIELASAYVTYPAARAEYTLDTGTEYRPGQQWEIDQSLELAGRSVRLLSVQSGREGYYVQVGRSGMQSVEVTIAHESPRQQGARSAEGDGPWVYPLLFVGEPPSGRVTFVLYSPVFKLEGPWKIEVRP